MQGFWKTWLYVATLLGLALGVALALAAFPATDGAARAVFASMGSADGGASLFESLAFRWALALQGAILIGWMLTVFGVIPSRDVNAWRWLTIGIVIWFVIDSTISVTTGFAANAVSNAVFLVLFLIPVLASGVLRGAAKA